MVLEKLTNLFPLWTALGGICAIIWPELFTWFKGPLIPWGLAIIMLGMGITLKTEDFQRIIRRPIPVVIGFGAQYTIMSLLSWLITKSLGLEKSLALGLILVGCSPGGTASNVVSFIARADVALSVTMTTCSTLAAVIATPMLTKLLAGHLVPVNAWSLFISTVQVVVLPVTIGVVLNQYCCSFANKIKVISPLISVIFIVLIVASVIAQQVGHLSQVGTIVVISVSLLHLGGFILGYMISRLFNLSVIVSRTISIEVGMQNSGLATVLAQTNFPDFPSAAIPCALSAIIHSLIGSILAGWWRKQVI